MCIRDRGSRIGFDPAIVNPDLYDRLVAISNLSGFTLVPCARDPFAAAWRDRPVPALARAFPYPVELAGETSESKRHRLKAALEAEAIDLLVETQLDNIAWLLNIRGSDVPDNPYVQAFAIASREGLLDLFVDERKLGNDKAAYELEQVHLHATADFPAILAQRIRETRPDATIVSDNRFSPALAKIQAVEANRSFEGRTSPLTRLKSVKNGTELAGMRSAAPVSYTHLDVYKRQELRCAPDSWARYRYAHRRLCRPAHHIRQSRGRPAHRAPPVPPDVELSLIHI